jgi:hypothetical protein
VRSSTSLGLVFTGRLALLASLALPTVALAGIPALVGSNLAALKARVKRSGDGSVFPAELVGAPVEDALNAYLFLLSEETEGAAPDGEVPCVIAISHEALLSDRSGWPSFRKPRVLRVAIARTAVASLGLKPAGPSAAVPVQVRLAGKFDEGGVYRAELSTEVNPPDRQSNHGAASLPDTLRAGAAPLIPRP